jgi:hypothetical protein
MQHGGVYTDTDSLLLRPLDGRNLLAAEYCDSPNLDYCFDMPEIEKQLRERKRSGKLYVPIGLLALDAGILRTPAGNQGIVIPATGLMSSRSSHHGKDTFLL